VGKAAIGNAARRAARGAVANKGLKGRLAAAKAGRAVHLVGLPNALAQTGTLPKRITVHAEEKLDLLGLLLVNHAKDHGAYTDRTADLRNSIGFEVKKLPGGKIILIFFAAMSYAPHVEKRQSHWVLSVSVKTYQPQIKAMLGGRLKRITPGAMVGHLAGVG